MSNLTELTAQIISARATKKDMSKEEFLEEMQMVYAFLKGVEDGTAQTPTQESAAEAKVQKINLKQVFKKDEVICLLCNKGFKTLKRHLSMAHGLKPGEYKKQFGIPAKQSLTAKSYVESRRKMAIDMGLGDGLAKARAIRAAKKVAAPTAKTKAPAQPAKKKAVATAKTTKTAKKK